MSKPSSNVDELVKELDKLYTNSVLEQSRNAERGQGEDEEAFNLPDAILVIDLNSREPMAAFVAPSLGIFKPTFLPIFKTMSEAHLLYLTESKYDLESGSLNQVNREWTRELLSHCQRLLLEKLGMPLEKINLQVSLTSRSDVSERDKFLLLQAAQDAGYQAPQLQLIPTVKAVAIAGFISHGAGEDDINTETFQRETWRFGDSVLVICHNGDVIDIQSYSISRGPIIDKSIEPRLKLEEIVSGSTVESRRLAEQQFIAWLEKSFGKSFLPGTKGLEPEGQLLSAFAEKVRDYQPKRQEQYKFPLIISSPADDAPYDPLDNCCVVPDSKMREFSMSAMDFLLESLDDNYTRVQNKKKKFDKILFAEPMSCSPYLKDFVTDWGSGMGILSRQTDIFVGFMTHELNPRTVAEVTLSSTHQNIDEIRMSPAHYGFKVDRPFITGTDDPWTFYTDPFSNKDYCSDTVLWHLRKDDPLESNFTLTHVVSSTFRDDTTSHETRIALYKCRLDEASRHIHLAQNDHDPDMELVGHLSVTFRRRDIERGEHKRCIDGISRRELRCKLGLQLFPTHGLIKATARSVDDQRVLGTASFEIHGVS